MRRRAGACVKSELTTVRKEERCAAREVLAKRAGQWLEGRVHHGRRAARGGQRHYLHRRGGIGRGSVEVGADGAQTQTLRLARTHLRRVLLVLADAILKRLEQRVAVCLQENRMNL